MTPPVSYLPDLAVLQSRLLSRIHEIDHGQSKLFACFPSPQECFPDQLWRMDLAGGWCEGLDQGEVTFTGTVEPIGVYVAQSERWEWAWNLPGSVTMREWISTQEVLKEIRSLNSFTCSEEFAELLANWISVNVGAIAAYPASWDGQTLYVAVRTPGRDPSRWCSLCGAGADDAYGLIPGRYGVVCTDCLDTMIEMTSEYRQMAVSPSEGVSCILCGATETFRVNCNRSSVCGDCLETHAALLPPRGWR